MRCREIGFGGVGSGSHSMGSGLPRGITGGGPGIRVAVLLGAAQALGETMIVMMVSGNAPTLDGAYGIRFEPCR